MAEATQSPAAAPASGRPRALGGIAIAIGSVALALFLVVVLRARLDIATAALVLVGLSLVACLRGMHRMVGALAKGVLDTVVETEGEYGGVSERELREERRRLLRAINELRFDHEMGKLSQVDYDSVRAGYELRALEVMRALDAGETLHPELAARLAKTDATVAAGPAATEAAPAAAAVPASETATETSSVAASAVATRACASCDGSNDPDAKFCKHCGKELVA